MEITSPCGRSQDREVIQKMQDEGKYFDTDSNDLETSLIVANRVWTR